MYHGLKSMEETKAANCGLFRSVFNPRRLWSFFISQEAQLPWQQLQPRVWLLAFRRLVYEFCTSFMCQVQPGLRMDFPALGFELQAYCCCASGYLSASGRALHSRSGVAAASTSKAFCQAVNQSCNPKFQRTPNLKPPNPKLLKS